MRTDYRWLVVVGGNLVFLFVVTQLDHYLTNVPLLGLTRGQVYLFLPGLPFAFACLRLNLWPAIFATVATALAIESRLPYPDFSGTVLVPATAAICGTFALRIHFNRFEASTAILVALCINLVILLVFTVVAYRGGGVSLSRVAVDLLLSQLAIVLLTSWFFAAQTALLGLFGFSLETELRETL